MPGEIATYVAGQTESLIGAANANKFGDFNHIFKECAAADFPFTPKIQTEVNIFKATKDKKALETAIEDTFNFAFANESFFQAKLSEEFIEAFGRDQYNQFIEQLAIIRQGQTDFSKMLEDDGSVKPAYKNILCNSDGSIKEEYRDNLGGLSKEAYSTEETKKFFYRQLLISYVAKHWDGQVDSADLRQTIDKKIQDIGQKIDLEKLRESHLADSLAYSKHLNSNQTRLLDSVKNKGDGGWCRRAFDDCPKLYFPFNTEIRTLIATKNQDIAFRNKVEQQHTKTSIDESFKLAYPILFDTKGELKQEILSTAGISNYQEIIEELAKTFKEKNKEELSDMFFESDELKGLPRPEYREIVEGARLDEYVKKEAKKLFHKYILMAYVFRHFEYVADECLLTFDLVFKNVAHGLELEKFEPNDKKRKYSEIAGYEKDLEDLDVAVLEALNKVTDILYYWEVELGDTLSEEKRNQYLEIKKALEKNIYLIFRARQKAFISAEGLMAIKLKVMTNIVDVVDLIDFASEEHRLARKKKNLAQPGPENVVADQNPHQENIVQGQIEGGQQPEENLAAQPLPQEQVITEADKENIVKVFRNELKTLFKTNISKELEKPRISGTVTIEKNILVPARKKILEIPESPVLKKHLSFEWFYNILEKLGIFRKTHAVQNVEKGITNLHVMGFFPDPEVVIKKKYSHEDLIKARKLLDKYDGQNVKELLYRVQHEGQHVLSGLLLQQMQQVLSDGVQHQSRQVIQELLEKVQNEGQDELSKELLQRVKQQVRQTLLDRVQHEGYVLEEEQLKRVKQELLQGVKQELLQQIEHANEHHDTLKSLVYTIKYVEHRLNSNEKISFEEYKHLRKMVREVKEHTAPGDHERIQQKLNELLFNINYRQVSEYVDHIKNKILPARAEGEENPRDVLNSDLSEANKAFNEWSEALIKGENPQSYSSVRNINELLHRVQHEGQDVLSGELLQRIQKILSDGVQHQSRQVIQELLKKVQIEGEHKLSEELLNDIQKQDADGKVLCSLFQAEVRELLISVQRFSRFDHYVEQLKLSQSRDRDKKTFSLLRRYLNTNNVSVEVCPTFLEFLNMSGDMNDKLRPMKTDDDMPIYDNFYKATEGTVQRIKERYARGVTILDVFEHPENLPKEEFAIKDFLEETSPRFITDEIERNWFIRRMVEFLKDCTTDDFNPGNPLSKQCLEQDSRIKKLNDWLIENQNTKTLSILSSAPLPIRQDWVLVNPH